MSKGENRANLALADFIAPTGADWIGAFAVTSGLGEAAVAERFKAAGDDYSAILAASLADRLAEAFAEALHHKVRAELWGYEPGEAFDIEALLAERYRGIRPAPGYPAQPDHTEKGILFDLLRAPEATGPLFRRGQDRARSGHRLCGAQGLGRKDRRALALADPELRTRLN
jgi:5-methyltetrahydrofolate--homocysteine methyltransferase